VFFQRVLKGVTGIDRGDATRAFLGGLHCNWWRRVHSIGPHEIVAKLTPRNLDWHLNHYDDPDPNEGNAPFREHTPFISVTAGVVERDAFARRNLVFDPFMTALRFATADFTATGYIFHAYVFTLGRQSLELAEFAEEVRELNIYQHFLPFHPEGEITAKIEIRGPCIERWEEYDGPRAHAELRTGALPTPSHAEINPLYASPDLFCNIRGLVTD
jgi:hypothetical protein